MHGIRNFTKVYDLIKALGEIQSTHEAQHHNKMRAIFQYGLTPAQRIKFMTENVLVDSSRNAEYMAVMIRCLFEAHGPEFAPNLARALVEALEDGAANWCVELCPVAIIGMTQATATVNSETADQIGKTFALYGSRATSDMREPNDWVCGNLVNSLAGYLKYNRDCAKRISEEVSRSLRLIEKPAHRIFSELNHKLFATLSFDEQFRALNHAF